MRILPIILAATALTLAARTNTTRPLTDQRTVMTCAERVTVGDTCTFSDKIILSGYKKTLNDAYESFFVDNKTPFRLSKLTVKFYYINAETGQKIHEETYDVPCDIPSGEMRQLTVRSFDRQHSFYYVDSRQPRRPATPYRIKYEIKGYDIRIAVDE